MRNGILASALLFLNISVISISTSHAALRDVYLTFNERGMCSMGNSSNGNDVYIYSSNNKEAYKVLVQVKAYTQTTSLGMRTEIYNKEFYISPKGKTFVGCLKDAAAYKYEYQILSYSSI